MLNHSHPQLQTGFMQCTERGHQGLCQRDDEEQETNEKASLLCAFFPDYYMDWRSWAHSRSLVAFEFAKKSCWSIGKASKTPASS